MPDQEAKKYGHGKSPKKGKGVGRKPIPESQKKEPTKVVSVRFPVSSINIHGIDSAWLFDAAMQKLSQKTGLNYQQPFTENFEIKPDQFAAQKKRIIELLSEEIEGETVFRDTESEEIMRLLFEMGAL